MALTVGQSKQIADTIEKILLDRGKLTSNVEACFAHFDADKSGSIDLPESQALVVELCNMMGVPPPTGQEFEAHFTALDLDKSGNLSLIEVGSGVVGALSYKVSCLKFYLAIAEKNKLADTADLPNA